MNQKKNPTGQVGQIHGDGRKVLFTRQYNPQCPKNQAFILSVISLCHTLNGALIALAVMV